MSRLDEVLLGAISMGFAVSGLFFFRFWRDTRDVLFLLFGVAFWVEAVNRCAFALLGDPGEGRPLFFILRLFAYLLIISGIVAKNLPRSGPPSR